MRITIAEILSAPWLIAPEKMGGYQMLLYQMLQGTYKFEGNTAEQREANRSYAASALTVVARSGAQTLNNADPGSIAVVPINGEIMKYDEPCGPRGTETIINEIRAIAANPNISGVIFCIDSPGGMVTNTDRLAAEIKALQKPKSTWVNGYCTSAAMWIGSSADDIFCSSPIDRVGSIGTMLSFMDVRPALEKMGVKFHEIYATDSTQKNADFHEILNGEYDNYRTNTLDPLNKVFHDAIKQNRPNADKSVFDGRSMFATDGIKLGLIDGIKTWDEMVNHMSERISQKSNSNMSTAKENGQKFKNVSAFFGFDEGFEITGDGFHLNESQLETLEAKLGEESTATETITALEGEKAALTEKVETLKAEVATLKVKPSAEPTKVKKDKDDVTSTETDTERLVTAAEIEREKLAKIKSFSFKDSD